MPYNSEISIRVVVNGTDHSFQREFGCTCGRCKLPFFRANTSVSVIAVDAKNTLVWHCLIDVGAGVVNNLVDNLSCFGGEPRVDQLLLTHWHPDHTIGINQLCETLRRSRKRQGLPAEKIPLWCRRRTLEEFQKRHSYEVNSFLSPQEAAIPRENEGPGIAFPALKVDDFGLEIFPISMSHGTADFNGQGYSTAGYVVKTRHRRVALMWDLDNQNNWILDETQSGSDARRLLNGVDTLFMDCNTWQVEESGGKSTGHIGFDRLRRYANSLQPRETVLIHISGHEDGPGNSGWGWSNAEWQVKASACWNDTPGCVCVLGVGQSRTL